MRADKKELIAELFAPKGFAPENRKRLRAVIEQLSELISMSDSDGVVAVLNGLIQRADQNEMLRNLNVPQLFISVGKTNYSVAAAEAVVAAQPPGRNRMARPFGPYGICRGAGTGVGNPDRVY